MASVPDQKIKEKKKRIPKKYDHSLPPPEVSADSRQNENKNKVKDINLKRLENYMWTKPTLQFTALFFGVSPEAIEDIIQQHYALTFYDFRELRLQVTKHSLIQHCIAAATEDKDFRALKFALQNLAGWSDSMQMQLQPMQTIQLKYSLDIPEPMKDVTPVTDSDIKVTGE